MKRRTDLIFTTIINNNKIKILSMEVPLNKFGKVTPSIVDHETGTPITASFSSISLSSSDENVFVCLDVDSDKYDDVKPIAKGTATLTYEADATYDIGGRSVIRHKSATLEVTVIDAEVEEPATDMKLDMALQDLP